MGDNYIYLRMLLKTIRNGLESKLATINQGETGIKTFKKSDEEKECRLTKCNAYRIPEWLQRRGRVGLKRG